MILLNLGCGSSYNTDWLNYDLVSHSPHVVQINLKEKIPHSTSCADFVYSSHFLEHLTKDEGISFLKESFRVLKSNSWIRIVVPDLFQACKSYVQIYEKLSSEGTEKRLRQMHEWIVIEIIDQLQRNYSGGEMRKFLLNKTILCKDFLVERLGSEVSSFFSSEFQEEIDLDDNSRKKHSVLEKLRLFLLRTLGVNLKALQIGEFRLKGENHYWMYDRFSLSALLENVGFINSIPMSYDSSNFSEFNKYSLDSDEKGFCRKPDSIFIEAMKP